jgi:molybdopterin synthase catalytic subunit
MSVEVVIVNGPLPPEPLQVSHASNVGAVVLFDGIVRDREADGPILALDYEAYEPMASRELERLAQELLATHGLQAIRVWHSKGRVPVGGVSFRLMVATPHRAEALRAMDEFITRMKRDVPIWKRAVKMGD